MGAIIQKTKLVGLAICAGVVFWGYKGVQSYQAYQVANASLMNNQTVQQSLGKYHLSFDWWFAPFRALYSTKVQRFEFHLNGEKETAVAFVEVGKADDWFIQRKKVVNGKYLNNTILDQ
jgi:hypothetical protein